MKLNDYLIKIEQGEPINLTAFIAKLNLVSSTEWRLIYTEKRIKQDQYILTIIDPIRHASFYEKIITNRSEGGKQGKSHSINTSFSHLLLFNQYCDLNTPHVIVSGQQKILSILPRLNNQAVIIENIENFYRYKSFMVSIGRTELLDKTDFIFGAGMQINNVLNTIFLSLYKQIYVASDLDLGGLKIYQALKKSFPNAQWLSPKNWQPFEGFFNLTPKSVQEWQQAIQLAEQLGLEEEAQLLLKNRAFIEQEAFLS